MIGVFSQNSKWYLYWKDTDQIIASFRTQIDAYYARRSILSYYNA